ncbi:purine-nucleoside phosphorylase [Thermogladius sp. 4427co]|uniref:purine-nucleoside phosphorylase n=1 Tax=Thermogladius sp. 4427co TaxID=3450718 RepID=UPI003F7A4BA8
MTYFKKPLHILAKPGEIAERVVTVGDPKRASLLKDLLEEARLVNENRGFYVYTGLYRNVPITVAVHGVGSGSAHIVFEELYMLGAKAIVRFGTTGALVEELDVGDIILARDASYYSGGIYIQYIPSDIVLSASADFHLLKHVDEYYSSKGYKHYIAGVVSADRFYVDPYEFASFWRRFGVVAVEMETAILYILSRLRGFRALSVLLVSNSLVKETGYPTTEELKKYVYEAGGILFEALASFRL